MDELTITPEEIEEQINLRAVDLDPGIGLGFSAGVGAFADKSPGEFTEDDISVSIVITQYLPHLDMFVRAPIIFAFDDIQELGLLDGATYAHLLDARYDLLQSLNSPAEEASK